MNDKIYKELLKNAEKEYGDFIHKITPSLKRENIIGVRVPVLRKIAKSIPNEDIEPFINELPHKYYEENLIHGYIIGNTKDYDLAIKRINQFLPYVDNWAVSDTMGPKCFIKNTDKLIKEIIKWINSKKTFSIRFGIDMLMSNYLDDYFKEEYLDIVANIKSDEYYVNMMIAWFYATALAKQWDKTIGLIESKRLDKWIQNKTIQKAIESYRITDSKKEYLKKLKSI